MATVELVVTDTRIWAHGPATHWDTPPSIVLGSTGTDLVVGEPLTPPTQVSSAVQFISGERIALMPRFPTVVESMTAVVGTVLENLRVRVPCDSVTVICPTEWGAHRRGVVDTAVGRFAAEVVFEDMAVRAVAADEGTARSRRTVVLEFGPLATTASAVIRSHRGIHIESCEHEPNLALSEIEPEAPGLDVLSALIGRLHAGQPVDVVQAVNVSDPAKLDLIRSVVQHQCGPAVELRPIAGPGLVGGLQQEPDYQPEAVVVPPANEWIQSLRERAAAVQGPDQRKTGPIAAAGGAVVVVAAAAIGAAVVFGGSDDSPAVATGPSAASTTAQTAAPTPSAAPTTMSAPETYGRVRFQTPAGWRIAPSSDSRARVDLVPEDGTRQRITVIQTPVVAETGYEQVATKLEAQMRQRPAGTLTDLKRDVVYGGRSGLAYAERPSDGSTVRWHVLVEHGLQVSIGCQYIDDWSPLVATCEKFATSVQVIP